MSDATIAAHGTAQKSVSEELPRRVRHLLQGIFELASNEFELALTASLSEFELQLFKFAEKGCSASEEVRWLEARRSIKRTRHELVPQFMSALNAELADLRNPSPAGTSIEARGGIGIGAEPSLFRKPDMDETTVVSEIANRVEMRNNLPLYLLGQRFGVLAGKPGFGPESIPIGPQAFCRMLRDASDCLGLCLEHRLIFFRVFESQVMLSYGHLIESVNNYLARNIILPNLQYMPTRARPKSEATAAGWTTEPGKRLAKGHAPRFLGLSRESDEGTTDVPVRAHEGIGSRQNAVRPASSSGPQGDTTFDLLRQLLASRNRLLEKLRPTGGAQGPVASEPVPAWLLQDTLHKLQGLPATPVFSAGKPAARNIQHVKQELLSHLRMSSGNQEASVLTDEDNDVIDLIGMLFENLSKDAKPNRLATQLLEKLQVPLLRVALQDKSFFTRQDHPAKKMLDVIAESGAYWLGDDDADPALLGKMNAVVDRTVREFDGDMSLFPQLVSDINGHLQLLTHKAEVAERRHVEAARGKERLALARDRASAAVAGLLDEATLPRFTRTLLSEAWTDVMALTALRQGEGSAVWKQQLGVVEQLIQVAKAPPGTSPLSADGSRRLKQELESALTQVGYQTDEAAAITQRMIDPQSGEKDDSASRTELTLRLKSQARFGADIKAAKTQLAPLTAEEQARHEQLKMVAFGTWFEFSINQQGDRIRRRLAWYSTTTGHSLFVNQRGQKVGEYPLAALAQMMVRGELHIAKEKAGGIIDRAWQSVMTTLRSFAGRTGTEEAST